MSFAKKSIQQIWKKITEYFHKNRIRCRKNCFQKKAEATGELIGNKIAEKVVKPKAVPTKNSRNVEEIVIQPEKRQEILHKLRQVLQNGKPKNI